MPKAVFTQSLFFNKTLHQLFCLSNERAKILILIIINFTVLSQVNIPLSSLGPPVLMGVALNHTSAGRPSAEFYVR